MAKEKILIVDDEKDFVETIADWLWTRGYNISKAFNGQDGLNKTYSERPDLIILDVMMPEMNGYDMCRKVKLDEKLKDIPVIILSAKFQPSDIKFGQEMGAELYLTKPLELPVLSEKINTLLKTKRIKNARNNRAVN